jgi:hypothetical protein
MVIAWAEIVWTRGCPDQHREETQPLADSVIAKEDTLVANIGNGFCALRFRGHIKYPCRRWGDALLRSAVGMRRVATLHLEKGGS